MEGNGGNPIDENIIKNTENAILEQKSSKNKGRGRNANENDKIVMTKLMSQKQIIIYFMFLVLLLTFLFLEFPIADMFQSKTILQDFTFNSKQSISYSEINGYILNTIRAVYQPSNGTLDCNNNIISSATTKTHLHLNFNLLVGVKATIFYSNVRINNGTFKSTYPIINMHGVYPDQSNIENTMDLLKDSEHSYLNFSKVKSSSIYIQYNEEEKEASRLMSNFLSENTAFNIDKVIFEVMFYNHNAKIGSTLFEQFKHSNGGLIKNEIFSAFLPYSYNTNHSNGNKARLYVKIIILIIVTAYSACSIIIAIVKFSKQIKNATIVGKCEFEPDNLVEFITSTFVLSMLIYWVSINVSMMRHSEFKLPMPQQNYDYFIRLSTLTRRVIRLLPACIFIVFIRVISLTYYIFPAFKILFMAFVKAKEILVFILIISFILLAGFTLSALQLFSSNNYFNKVGNAFMQLFKAGIGLTIYDDLNKENPTTAWIFYLIYIVVFSILLSRLAMGVIIGTYNAIWISNNEDVVANARILSENNEKLKEKIMNLITCRPPNNIEAKNCKSILQLNIKSFCESKCPYVTKQKILQDIATKKKEIHEERKQKVESNHKKLAKFYENVDKSDANLYKLEALANKGLKKYITKMVVVLSLRVLFALLYIWMSSVQLNVYKTYVTEESVRNYIETNSKIDGRDLNFYEINNPNQFADWLYVTLFKLETSGFIINKHMISFSECKALIFLRRFIIHQNNDNNTKEAIKFYRSNSIFEINSNYSNEECSNNTEGIWNSDKCPYRKYKSQDSGDIPNKFGAYEIKITDQYLSEYNLPYQKLYFLLNDPSLGLLLFDHMVYEPISKVIVYSRAEAQVNAFGKLIVDHNVLSFVISYYSGLQSLYCVLDLIVVGIFIYLLICEIKKFVRRFPSMIDKDPKDISQTRSSYFCYKLFGIESTSFEKKPTIEKLCWIILYSIKIFFKFLFYQFKTMISYLQKIKHIIYFAHVIVTIYCIIIW